MGNSKDQRELISRRSETVVFDQTMHEDPVAALAAAWRMYTGEADLPLRFEADCAVMLVSTPPERIRSAILEATNRPSVTPARRWNYVLTSLHYYLTALEPEPEPETRASRRAAKERPMQAVVVQGVVRGLVYAVIVGAFVALTAQWGGR